MTVEIRVDAKEVTEALDKLDAKGSATAIKAAVRKGAQYLKPKMKVAAPKDKGTLRKKVGFRVKKGRQSGDVYAAIRSFAPHHHLVVEGTRQRFTRSGASRGRMPAQPYVDRVAGQHGDAALRIAEAELIRQLDLD